MGIKRGLQSRQSATTGYREDKLAQATQLFLDLSGGEVDLVQLQRMLYLLERKTFLSTGRPSFGGSYIGSDDGPLLLELAESIRTGIPGDSAGSFWMRHFDIRGRTVFARVPVQLKVLSRIEKANIESILKEYGSLNFEQTITPLGKACPEWNANLGRRFGVVEILLAEGKSREFAEGIKAKIDFEQEITSRCVV